MEPKNSDFQIITYSADETSALGRSIGAKLIAGDILALTGELGSGKTCFTAGLARGLGVDETYQITSPTFTLINEYPARFKLCHFDLYRLEHYADMDDLGYEEYLSGENVLVIEWAEKIDQIIPRTAIFINFEYMDENKRRIIIRGLPDRLKDVSLVLKNGG